MKKPMISRVYTDNGLSPKSMFNICRVDILKARNEGKTLEQVAGIIFDKYNVDVEVSSLRSFCNRAIRASRTDNKPDLSTYADKILPMKRAGVCAADIAVWLLKESGHEYPKSTVTAFCNYRLRNERNKKANDMPRNLNPLLSSAWVSGVQS